jgi:GYF domain 2
MPEDSDDTTACWWYVIGKTPRGPINERELVRLSETGLLIPETLVWAVGFSNWVPYAKARKILDSDLGILDSDLGGQTDRQNPSFRSPKKSDVPAPPRNVERISVFISHSSSDADLAESLIDLVRAATSTPDYRSFAEIVSDCHWD